MSVSGHCQPPPAVGSLLFSLRWPPSPPSSSSGAPPAPRSVPPPLNERARDDPDPARDRWPPPLRPQPSCLSPPYRGCRLPFLLIATLLPLWARWHRSLLLDACMMPRVWANCERRAVWVSSVAACSCVVTGCRAAGPDNDVDSLVGE